MDIREEDFKQYKFVSMARRLRTILCIPLCATYIIPFMLFFNFYFGKYKKRFNLCWLVTLLISGITIGICFLLDAFAQMASNPWALILGVGIFAGWIVGDIVCAIMVVILSREKIVHFDDTVDEVDLSVGKKGVKKFKDAVTEKAGEEDFDGYAQCIYAAHEYYLSKIDVIYPKAEAERVMREIFISTTIFEGKKKGEEIKKRLKKVYVVRDYETIRELYAEYSPRLEEYKQELKAKGEEINCEPEFDGKGNFDGWLIQKIGWNILCNIVNVLTLFIAYPATVCWKERWYKKHTVYDGKRLCFDGNGLQLFGKYIVWFLLTVITVGIYGIVLAVRVEKWKAKHTHIAGEYKALGGTFDGWTIQKFFLSLGCMLLNVITLTLVKPFTVCWKERWLCKHRVYDGRRLYFDGNGFQLIGKWILWKFLTLITLGIYGLFVSIRMEKWKAKHTHVTEYYECAL